MLHAANTDLFYPLVPKAPNSECQNLFFPLQIEPEKFRYSWFAVFHFLHYFTVFYFAPRH